MAADHPSLLYIMGRGHSGSTVLDALIGNAADVEGVGELISGWLRLDSECSCGRTIEECFFWSEVRRDFERRSGMSWSRAGRLLHRQAIVKQFPGTLFSRQASGRIPELREINRAIIQSIASVSGKSWILDSSKEVTRGLFLARFLPGARIIHLVRRPDGILASNLHRIRRGEGFRFLRRDFRVASAAPLFLLASCINWMIGNLLAEVVALKAGKRLIRVRFEDLCADPVGEMRRIGRFLEVDVSSVVEGIESRSSMGLGHKIAGNKMRTAGSFRFDSSRLNGRPLPRLYRWLAFLIGWPLLWRYGYFSFRRGVRPPESPSRAGVSS